MRLEEIIKRPLIFTEKGANIRETMNKYVFEVALNANKIQIREAIEDLFKVQVTDVNTLIMRGKKRRMGRVQIKARNWKKAIVTLQHGDSIDVFEGA